MLMAFGFGFLALPSFIFVKNKSFFFCSKIKDSLFLSGAWNKKNENSRFVLWISGGSEYSGLVGSMTSQKH